MRYCRRCTAELIFDNFFWLWVAKDDGNELCTPTEHHDPSPTPIELAEVAFPGEWLT